MCVRGAIRAGSTGWLSGLAERAAWPPLDAPSSLGSLNGYRGTGKRRREECPGVGVSVRGESVCL